MLWILDTHSMSSYLFSDWRLTVSSKFFDTQLLRFPVMNLCSLVTLAVPSIFFAASLLYSFLLSSYFTRIGRTENPSCSAWKQPSQDISHFILHCPATDSLRRSSLCLSTTSGPSPEKLPGFWSFMVFCYAHIPWKWSDNNINKSQKNERKEVKLL